LINSLFDLLFLVVFGYHKFLKSVGFWNLNEVETELLDVHYHIRVEIDDLSLNKGREEDGDNPDLSFLGLLVRAISALAHLFVQKDLDELLGQLNCC
jgi:hypothetical protein